MNEVFIIALYKYSITSLGHSRTTETQFSLYLSAIHSLVLRFQTTPNGYEINFFQLK